MQSAISSSRASLVSVSACFLACTLSEGVHGEILPACSLQAAHLFVRAPVSHEQDFLIPLAGEVVRTRRTLGMPRQCFGNCKALVSEEGIGGLGPLCGPVAGKCPRQHQALLALSQVLCWRKSLPL